MPSLFNNAYPRAPKRPRGFNRRKSEGAIIWGSAIHYHVGTWRGCEGALLSAQPSPKSIWAKNLSPTGSGGPQHMSPWGNFLS